MNILLICSAGMSTSMMVQRMKEEAHKQGMDANIWAVAEAMASDEVKKADVVLLGPQIRFKLPQIKELCAGTPVDAIDMRVYGRMDGGAVLHKAMEMGGQ